jgi:hypothetical protein
MPFDASLIKGLFDAAKEVIQPLKNVGIKFDQDLILHHDSKLMEFKYSLNIGMNASHTQEFVRKLRSKLAKPFEIPPDADIYVVPDEDISHYVTETGKQKIIDIPRMFEELSSSTTIIIIFKQHLQDALLKELFPAPHTFRNPVYTDDNRIEIPIELVCDYARLWHKQYDSFKITDIKKTDGIMFVPDDIINRLLPEDLKKIVNEARKANFLDGDMMLHLQSLSGRFQRFATDEGIKVLLSRAINPDKTRNILIENVWGTTREVDIKGRKLTLPFQVMYTVNFDLEGRELALSAKLVIDNGRIETIIRDLAEDI